MRIGIAAVVIGSVLVATTIVASTGCQSSSPARSATPSIKTLEGTWTAQTIDGGMVSAMLEEGMRAPDLRFLSDGSVVGFTGVNRINTRVDLEKLRAGEFSVGPSAMTMMAGPPAAMRMERRFVDALERAAIIEVEGNTMRLTDGGETVLTLVRGS